MKRFIFRLTLALLWFGCSTIAKEGSKQPRHQNINEDFISDNTTSNSYNWLRKIDDFPELFTREQRLHGAIILHFLLSLYCFIFLAYICNDYFLPSVECICVDLNLSQDVAGATFMAIATSTPELFVNIIGTFITKSDLGVGAVMGSAVFNTFGVAAASGLATIEAIHLDWWPLTRDCTIYLITLSVLTLLIWDQSIFWKESIIMVVMLVLYFVIMAFNNPLMRFAKFIVGKCCGKGHDFKDEIEIDTLQSRYREYAGSHVRSRATSSVRPKQESIDAETQLENLPAPTSPFEVPKGIASITWWSIIWPILILLFCTIPNCRNKHLRRLYPLTFLMCIVWLGVISYILSWMISVIGGTFSIPDSVLGLTLLAIGGCLPETISSIIMVRQGEGSMGISNSLGANTLDILMCLGLPWIVKSAMAQEPVEMESDGLHYSCLALIGLVVVYYGIMCYFKFILNRVLGITYACLYIAYITFAVLFELDVFTKS